MRDENEKNDIFDFSLLTSSHIILVIIKIFFILFHPVDPVCTFFDGIYRISINNFLSIFIISFIPFYPVNPVRFF
jgi:hypothetical protein